VKTDINHRDPDGSTPLLWAVYDENVAEASRLLKAGATVSLANNYGASPMGGLSAAQAEPVIRAFSLYFRLVNLAEQNHRIRAARCWISTCRTLSSRRMWPGPAKKRCRLSPIKSSIISKPSSPEFPKIC